MKTKSLATKSLITLALSATLLSPPAWAHRAWLLPQSTVLAGDSPMVTVEGAISNSIFVADYHALRADGLTVTNNSGASVTLQNQHTGRFRTTFDIVLEQPGTYRIASAARGLTARWQDTEGNRGMFPGRGQPYDDNALSDAIPADAENVQISLNSRRIETFVTAGAPSYDVLEPSGEGLEMRFQTHPNDLFNQETADFQLLIDGDPAAGAEIIVIKDGDRYRNQPNELIITSDQDGRFSITWEEAGMYWLEASYQDQHAPRPASTRRGTYVATLEVLPE